MQSYNFLGVPTNFSLKNFDLLKGDRRYSLYRIYSCYGFYGNHL